MAATRSVLAWSTAGVLLMLALAGCAEPSDSSAAPLRMRSSQTTLSSGSAAEPEVGTQARVLEGTVSCSVANRFFWFPDTTRSCGSENTKTLTIPANAVRIDVSVAWDAAQPAARNLTLLVTAAEGGIELDRTSGPSSLQITVGERLSRNHFFEGGLLGIRVDAATGVLGTDYEVDVAAAFVQDYTLTVTTTHEILE